MAETQLLALTFLALAFIQFSSSAHVSFKWCLTKTAEKSKCDDFVKYVNEAAQILNLHVTVGCVQGNSSDDCVAKIASNAADLVTLDGGRVFDAGRSKDLIPIVSEKYGKYGVKYYAVAVVKKSNTGFNLESLEGKKSCHTGARRTAGWRVPIGYMLRTKLLPAVACGDKNNDFLSVAKFFSQSCVPGVKGFNDSGDIPGKLCALCKGTGDNQCSGDSGLNVYAGYHGSFKCMADGTGDVGFVKHTTTNEVLALGEGGSQDDYEYLCKDGTRKAIGTHEKCHLGFNPAHAVVTRKSNDDIEDIIRILIKMSELYGVKQTNSSNFQLFNSTKYGKNSSNLLFKDSSTELVEIQEGKRTYQGFLGDDYVKDADALQSCDFMSTTPPESPTPAATATKSYTVLVPFTALLVMLTM